MRKLSTFLLLLAFALGLASCGQQQDAPENDQDYFHGTVLEVYDDSILVECLTQTSGAVSPGARAIISADVAEEELSVGNTIRVVFSGVQETDPLGFDSVFAIDLLDETGNPIP